MNSLTTKQKVILGIILGFMILIIGIYGYTSLNNDDEIEISEIGNNFETEEILNEEQQSIEENSSSEDSLENINEYEDLEGKIIIHITGEVKNTGILLLPEGARIADAIKAAGGETLEADLDEVNLAYELEDGQKIYIPNKNENVENEKKEYITSESGNNVIVESKTSSKEVSSKVNINTANQSELETLPGIGETIAIRIIEYREQNGKFEKIEDLQNVKGIGDSKFANIKDYIVVK